LLPSLNLQEIPKEIKKYNYYAIITLAKNNINDKAIAEFTNCSKEIVQRWKSRSNINDKFRSGRPLIYNEEMQTRLIAFYCQTKPMIDSGRWTLRFAEKELATNSAPVGLAVSHSTIHRILKKHNLKPHQVKYFLQITDPDFFKKMEHLIKIYTNQPKYLFSFDECPGIQVLQRLAPDLQTDKMKRRLEEFEYIRNGTLDVFAFFRVENGKVFAECRADHTKKTLIEVFEKHLKTLPTDEPIHYVMDNLASHSCYELCELVARYSNVECPGKKQLKTAIKRREWLQLENKRIIFHYTPFHGSWLNLVEIWFGSLNQKCLKESYNSPEAIYKAIYSFTDKWNTILYHPFKWKYDGSGLHQKVVSRFIKMLENNIDEMTILFMSKQIHLMFNLIKTYWDKVNFEIWMKLYNLLISTEKKLNEIISKDDKPKRKEKAEYALKNLIESLSSKIENIQTEAA